MKFKMPSLIITIFIFIGLSSTELKIAEIEINPLFVYENQVKAIDAVIAVGN